MQYFYSYYKNADSEASSVFILDETVIVSSDSNLNFCLILFFLNHQSLPALNFDYFIYIIYILLLYFKSLFSLIHSYTNRRI